MLSRYRRFTRQSHIDLWKSENAKDPKLGFGSPMYGNEGWGWNDKWVAHVREHCAKNSERYGKRGVPRVEPVPSPPSSGSAAVTTNQIEHANDSKPQSA
jgi:hypothetical protein